MERSRVTVEYSHLPGQVFEHEAAGIFCETRAVTGGSPNDLRIAPVLEALEHTLEIWRAQGGVATGFPSPVTDYEDEFRLVEPRSVEFDVFPTWLFCSNRACGHLIRAQRVEEIPERRTCKQCRTGVYQQMRYFTVHSCGARADLRIPSCPEHSSGPVAFEDSRSFRTAGFRCLTCRRPLEITFRRCNCGMTWRGPGASAADAVRRPVTVRDSQAYFGHHLTLVSVGGTRLTAALAAPRGVHYALGHYLGAVTDLAGLADEASGRRPKTGQAGQEALQRLRDLQPDLPPDILDQLSAAVNANRGDTPALEATENALTADTFHTARSDRRLMERAFLYAEHAVDDLASISDRLQADGHPTLASRVKDGLTAARDQGLARVSVVRDFPIALIGYGYTREHNQPTRAQLKPLPHYEGDRLPLVAVEARTEGLLIELDPLILWHWCAANGWAAPPPPNAGDPLARAWLLDTTCARDPGEAAQAIRRATHAYSHLLMHALAAHSSYSSNSVSEYLMERQASTLIYVAKYTSFNLGGLATLAEQHLRRWLESAASAAWTCVHDPICLSERGGCHKCLAVAFGCESFNRGLDRGYLVGGGPQNITEGFLFTSGARQSGGTP
ncbi:Zn-binding domain-containing protein [Pseudofrankia sp. BMG5.37]|uniref:Zn-binding domain-containing protein n=1 Tax=Pseudofrankia sp. BMG5.37 TaxID=3050035 RepID=UPI002895D052|nr:Zn-binding domain-containing protein [Pseudofrankia sp. BMG5.37]MDT3438737.1 hypothetical protein [Pseudofrankia sp. BMG5.37]